jgi:type II secretion system protein N
MDKSIRTVLIVAGVLVYCLIVAVLAAHFRFPYAAAARNATEQIEKAGPVRIEYSGLKPGRPFVVKTEKLCLGVETPAGRLEVVCLDEVSISPRFLSLLTGNLGVDFRLSGGNQKGRGYALADLPGAGNVRIEVEDVYLPDFSVIDPQGQGSLRGPLKGRMVIEGRDGVIPSGGEGVIEIGPGRIEGIQAPQLPFQGIDFDRAVLEFHVEGQQIRVDKLEVESPQAGMLLSGRIRFLRTLEVNLSGEVRLGPSDNPTATAVISVVGPMNRPRINVTNMRLPSPS